MRRRAFVTLLLIPVLLTALGAAKPQPMYQPKPLPVPEDVSMEDVHKAIQRAVISRRWAVEEDNEAGGTLVATLHVRVHMVKVKITYDLETIRFSYLDSDKMRYKKTKKGVELIHPKYGTWVLNLRQSIQLELLRD